MASLNALASRSNTLVQGFRQCHFLKDGEQAGNCGGCAAGVWQFQAIFFCFQKI
jgi:hypothetical protein